MSVDIETERLTLRLRDERDAVAAMLVATAV